MATAESLCQLAGIAWHEEGGAGILAETLAETVATGLQLGIDSNGAASLVVSGGSTPAPVFKHLSAADIDWQNVSVTLADERWVPADHPDSNERLVRSTLLVDKASVASFVPLYLAALDVEAAETAVATAVGAMRQPFTVVILGMGEDGHTASLFPDAPAQQLHRAMQVEQPAIVCAMHPPSVDQARMTLSRSALLNADRRYLHITGESKQQVLLDALLQSRSGNDDNDVPGSYNPGMKPVIGLLTHQPERATVFWSP
ncbi:MAG: 6-phosphogluconolactonase [Granulosicoccus sp.]